MPRMPRTPRWLLLAFAPLLACTTPPAATPTSQATPTKAAEPAPPLVEPAPPLVAPTPPTPPLEPPAAAPTPTEPTVSWWCICYLRTAAIEADRMTACRREESECHALERAVAAGKAGMLARSLSRPCIELTAAHPGDVHGGRAAWVPSKKPGSWMSVGECRLPGEGEFIQNDTSKDHTMMDERIGELALGMSAADLIAQLGEPARKGRMGMSQVSGEMVQTWTYPALGLSLEMTSDDRSSAQSIAMITLKAPGTFTTRFGVTIGSTREQVIDVYGKLRDPLFPSGDQEEVFLAGSIYGGVFFTFKNNKVSKIFVGAGAE